MQFRPGQCYRKKLAGAFCTGSQKNRGKTMDISSKMLGDLTLKVSASLELEKMSQTRLSGREHRSCSTSS